jgi:hypothetical protein
MKPSPRFTTRWPPWVATFKGVCVCAETTFATTNFAAFIF